MRKRYPSDISKEAFEEIRPLLESVRKQTKPRTVDLYEVFCGVLYLLKSGCQWRMLPSEYPKWRTVHAYFAKRSEPGPDGLSVLEQALKKCRSSNCHLVATFANACGVIVTPDSGMRTVEDFFVGVDPDDRKAAAKSIQACEAKHGHNKCSYWGVKTKHGTAFCTGYDYSVYEQK